MVRRRALAGSPFAFVGTTFVEALDRTGHADRFEGDDFASYWGAFAEKGRAELSSGRFPNGEKGVRLQVDGGSAGIRQGRVAVQPGVAYDGSAWLDPERGDVRVRLLLRSSAGAVLAATPLVTTGSGWQEVRYAFTSPLADTQAVIEVVTRHAPDFDPGSVEMRVSKKNRYLSLTCTVRATSREQLDALYQALCDHPQVVMVL